MGLLEPHGRYRDRDGQAHLSAGALGRLLGIARKARPRAVPEALDHAAVGLLTGIAGDFRGAMRPGKSGRRQVTVMTLGDWQAALAELGVKRDWTTRRVNLLVDGIELPRDLGVRLSIGSATFEITGECEPCHRMEEVAPGLFAALKPGWRGGRLMRVAAEGEVRVGDSVTAMTLPLPLMRSAG